MSTLKHIIRGCGTLTNCGEHPGTIFLVGFVLMGAVAGAPHGCAKALGGAAMMLVVFGSIYLYGAYDRSKTEERIENSLDRKQP